MLRLNDQDEFKMLIVKIVPIPPANQRNTIDVSANKT